MTALERAARALVVAEGAMNGDGDVNAYADAVMAATVHDGDCTKQAHTCLACERKRATWFVTAALRALREPDEAMLAPYYLASWLPPGLTVDQVKKLWRYQIDSILAEPTGETR